VDGGWLSHDTHKYRAVNTPLALNAFVTYDSRCVVLTIGTPAASRVLRLPPSMQDLYWNQDASPSRQEGSGKRGEVRGSVEVCCMLLSTVAAPEVPTVIESSCDKNVNLMLLSSQ
jgi:hypothetical protein